jgi:hypothetical protein
MATPVLFALSAVIVQECLRSSSEDQKRNNWFIQVPVPSLFTWRRPNPNQRIFVWLSFMCEKFAKL